MKVTFLVLLATLWLGSASPVPQRSTVCLRPEEMKLYNLLMDYRKSKKLASTPLSAKLTHVAQLHAKDLAEHFNSKNGKCNIHSWSAKGKWKACCYTDDHKEPQCMWNKPREITGYPSEGYEIAYFNSGGATAQEGLTIWKASPGHNPVIVNEGVWKSITWKAVGVGIYKEYGVVWFGAVADEPVDACK
jgi:hypothetical protein